LLNCLLHELDLIKEYQNHTADAAKYMAIGGVLGFMLDMARNGRKNNEIAKQLKDLRRKYQIFVSSTIEDLKKERKAVIEAILERKHIPISMEQFSASNMSQMDFIKQTMDECDYVILIIGERYGTIDNTSIQKYSYTEQEYNYAIEKKFQY